MPENRGNATSYAGGRTHRPLPRADEIGYRAPHPQRDPKPTSTFNWDWNKADCTSCHTKVARSTLVDGMCRTCRGEPEVLPPAPAREVYSPYEDDELEAIYHPDHHLPDVPDLPETEPVDEPLAEPDREPEPVAEPAPAPAAARVARELRTPTRRPVHDVDLLEECIQHAERTLRAAHGREEPIVGILRSAALSAIAALDFYIALHCTDSRGTAGPPIDGAASTTTPAHTPGLGGTRPAAASRGEARQRPARARARTGTVRPRTSGVRRPAVDVDEAAVVLEYAAGDTSPTIARRHGVQPKRIRQILTAHGVQLRDDRTGHSGSHRRVEDDHELNEQVRRLYVDEQLATADVAERLQIGRKRVTRILDVLGVQLRPAAHLAHPELSEEDEAQAVELYLAGRSLADVGHVFGVRQQTIRDLVAAAGHPIRAKGASAAIAERMRELGITASQVKDWAVATGLVESRPAGLVGRALIDAYVTAHHQEGPAA